jgi:hypothetical protein
MQEVTFNGETGVATFDDMLKGGTLIFFINGLMTVNGADYTENQNEVKDVESVTLLGDAKTLAENGSVLRVYGVVANQVSTVESGINSGE